MEEFMINLKNITEDNFVDAYNGYSGKKNL